MNGDRAVHAAVAWGPDGFEISTAGLDRDTTWRGARVSDVHRMLLDLQSQVGDRLTCVVDSTNGMVDGGLMSAGLAVARADPSMLPARPALGSVTARQLAAAAAANPRGLAPLVLETGSLTGRSAEVDALVTQASEDLHALEADGRCVSAGGTDRPWVALTFDDGPHPPFTDRILATLERYAVPATFFCVGLHVRAHRDLVARIADAGHRLGNHTYSHPLLADLDAAQLRVQLDRTDELVGDAADRLLFRPPYGAIDPAFMRLFADDPARRSMVLWDVEPGDWARPGADVIAERTVAGVRPGSIVLLHDGGGDRSQTADALPRIIETLLERNYVFVTADAMFTGRPIRTAGHRPASTKASTEFMV